MTFLDRVRASRELRWRMPLAVLGIVGGVLVHVYTGDINTTCVEVGNVTECSCEQSIGEWSQIYWYSMVLILTAQISSTVREFFRGEGPKFFDQALFFCIGKEFPGSMEVARQQVGFWTLMPSAFISWIFAKSINNAATWGGMFGVMGGVAYAGWYVSFFSAAFVGYWLRVKYGFSSLPTAVDRCYGPVGLICLNVALLFRLWNEIWSNIAVVASFYSDTIKTPEWWV